jgi:hypothetical protein
VTGAVQRFKQNDIHGYIKTAAGKTHVVLVCVGANGAFEVRYRMSPRSCHSWAQPQQSCGTGDCRFSWPKARSSSWKAPELSNCRLLYIGAVSSLTHKFPLPGVIP